MAAGFVFVRAVVTRRRPCATRPFSSRASFLPPSVSCGCVATASDRTSNRQSAASKLPGCSFAHAGGAVDGGVVTGAVVEVLVAPGGGTPIVVVVVVVVAPGGGTVVLVAVVEGPSVVLVVVVVGGAQASPQHGRVASCTVSSSGSIVAPGPITGGASRYSRRLREPAVSVPLIVIWPDARSTLLASCDDPPPVAEMTASRTTSTVHPRSVFCPPVPWASVASERSVP